MQPLSIPMQPLQKPDTAIIKDRLGSYRVETERLREDADVIKADLHLLAEEEIIPSLQQSLPRMYGITFGEVTVSNSVAGRIPGRFRIGLDLSYESQLLKEIKGFQGIDKTLMEANELRNALNEKLEQKAKDLGLEAIAINYF